MKIIMFHFTATMAEKLHSLIKFLPFSVSLFRHSAQIEQFSITIDLRQIDLNRLLKSIVKFLRDIPAYFLSRKLIVALNLNSTCLAHLIKIHTTTRSTVSPVKKSSRTQVIQSPANPSMFPEFPA